MQRSRSTTRIAYLAASIVALVLLVLPGLALGQDAGNASHARSKATKATIPDPILNVLSDSNVGEILGNGPSIAGRDGSDLAAFFKITSFSVSIIHNKNLIYERNFKAGPYESEFLELVNAANLGDLIVWENIKVVCPDNLTRTLVSVIAKKTDSNGTWEIRRNRPCVR